MKYCRFGDERGEVVVFINPTAVRYLRTESEGQHTRIVFDDSQLITVKSVIEDAVNKLQSADQK